MLAYYRLADRQTHSGSFARLLGGEERREEPTLVLRCDARAGIFERKHHARTIAAALRLRGYLQRSAAALHRVECVHDHVHEQDRKSTRLNSSHLGISY